MVLPSWLQLLKAKQRDSEMKQTKKGKQWYFGMKTYIEVDATSVNVADVAMAGHLVHDEDPRVYGDAGYTGRGKYLSEERMIRIPGAASPSHETLLRRWKTPQ